MVVGIFFCTYEKSGGDETSGIEFVSELDHSGEVFGAGFRVRGFIGNGPKDDEALLRSRQIISVSCCLILEDSRVVKPEGPKSGISNQTMRRVVGVRVLPVVGYETDAVGPSSGPTRRVSIFVVGATGAERASAWMEMPRRKTGWPLRRIWCPVSMVRKPMSP